VKLGLRVTKDNTPAVLAAIGMMTRKHVVVGVPASEDARRPEEDEDAGPMGNAAVYYVQDNGSALANIPPRETLRPGVKDAAPRLANVLKQAAVQAFSNKGALDRGLEAAGLVAQTAVRKRIVAGTDLEPLAESTIKSRRARGIESEKPLIRTAQMLNAITYEVRDK
jgi:hypothetical protein